MSKIYKQMFDNKIIQIIAIIWLLKQSQSNISVAGQPAMGLTAEAIITAVATTQLQQEHKKNIEKHVIKTYDMTPHNSANNNSTTTTTGNSNSTTTASNKLNVNNTDTQMTLKLKDATAINDFTTNHSKTFTLQADIQSDKNGNFTKHSKISEYIPRPTNTAQLSQDVIKSSDTFVLLSSPPNHYITQSQFNHKRKFIKTNNALQLHIKKSSKINLTSPEQTSTQNSIMNINLINTTDLRYPRFSKDMHEINSRKRTSVELIVTGKSLQAANESNQTASKSLKSKQMGKNVTAQAAQSFFNTTSVSLKTTNKEENSGNSEVNIQKQLKVSNHIPEESKNLTAESKWSSEKIKTSNGVFVNDIKNSTMKTFDLTQDTKNDHSLKTHMKNINYERISRGKAYRAPQYAKNDRLGINSQASNVTYKPEFHNTLSSVKNNMDATGNDAVQRMTKTENAIKHSNSNNFKEILQSFPRTSQNGVPLTSIETLPLQGIEKKLYSLKQIEIKFIEEIDSKLQQMHKEYNNIKDELKTEWQNKYAAKPTEENKKQVNKIKTEVTQTNNQNSKEYLETNKKETPHDNKMAGNRKKQNEQQLEKENLDIKNNSKHISTFPRHKRLHSNERNGASPTYLSTAVPNFQLENSTTADHNPYKINQNNEMKPPPMVNIDKTQNTLRNESIILETEYVSKSNFINQRQQSAWKTASGNRNNTMNMNSLMNNKPMASNLNKNNQLADNEKYAVNETNAINLETATRPSVMTTLKSKPEVNQKEVQGAAIAKGYSITDSDIANITPTAETRGHLLEFQTTLATAVTTLATLAAPPFIGYQKSLTHTNAPHSFSPSDGILLAHDLISTKLVTATEESNIMIPTNTTSVAQLNVTSAGLPFEYAASMSVMDRLSSLYSSSSSPFATPTAAATTTSSWPVKHASVVEGNVILGGLMMVHSREDSITCGPIMPQGGIQALEAMLYTLDQVNKQQLLPNITLGAHILDDCDKDTYGLEMAVDFIKDDLSFYNDTRHPYPTHLNYQHHVQPHLPQTGDYFAASPRSGRHRGRATAHIIAGHNLLHSVGSKKFRSLPETEHDYQMQRLLYALPTQRHWPVKREAVVEGNVILGGLMMVHSREDTITCGPIMPQGGIQALEAMLYTTDRINDMDLLPNITLGAHILDDCDKDSYGLEMAVDFIKGSISNIDDAEYHCNKTTVRKVISGVVGAASSVTSIQVANLLRLFRIPQVSFFSTSPELSNKQRFEYFSRTIPSDHYQVKAMVEIVKRMSWSYVSIIYEESNYGIKAFEELEELLARHNICIAVKEKLVKDSGVADEIAYDNIVQKLLTKPRARGAIIFGSDQEVREVMRAVRRNNATGAFSWIGSDGWSARNLVSDGNEPEVEGTLSVQPQANPVKGFEEYFLNLTVENNKRNPWFVEFWEDHFQCRYPGSASTPYNNYNRSCTTSERLSREDTDFEGQLQFVSDAVMAFAYALRDMHRDLCGGQPSLCDAMKPTKGADLLKYLRKVQFQGLSGDHFLFDNNGDGPARYNIIHFKQSNEGQYHWIKVGEYYEGELRLNMSEVQFKLLHPKPPESVCSLPCERGQAKKYVEGESCCWHCFNCSTYQIRHPLDETQCIKCKLGTLPDATKQFCQTIPEVYLRPESAWAIGAMSFSATGILVTLFIVGVFVRHNDTPVVRASGRELSYILLAGILMCYAVTFALVLKPTNIVCAIQRFGVGFCFTVVYAALLTKTNRIARIFKAGKQSAKRPSFISPKSQLVICSFFIFIQILINGVWMLIAPSHAKHYHPTREDNLLVCDSYIDASYVIAFFYPIVLIVVCTVYAVLTRKIPEAFNESKHIGFTMYTTCVIWLAFVPLYFGTGSHVPLRITSMSVTISLSASVTIACLFSPKLYIILIRPERNVRQSMMPPRYANMHRTANTGPSSMMAAAVVTAATCAQEEKIQKHITPTNTEHSLQKKNLCEMATQTIAITSIFTNLDSSAYNQIPYADDQYVPNNNFSDKETHHNNEAIGRISIGTEDEIARTVANNNKINQQHHQHPHPHHQSTNHVHTTTATAATIASNQMLMSPTINCVVCATIHPLHMTCCCNHMSAPKTTTTTIAAAAITNFTPPTASSLPNNESTGCIKSPTLLASDL